MMIHCIDKVFKDEGIHCYCQTYKVTQYVIHSLYITNITDTEYMNDDK